MNPRFVLRFAIVSVVIVAIISIMLVFWRVLAPFLASYILFFVLKPVVNFLEKRGLGHTPAALIVFFCAFGGVLLLLVLLVPAFIAEFGVIRENLDDYSRSFGVFVTRIKTFLAGLSSSSSALTPGTDYYSILEKNLKGSLQYFVKRIPSLISSVALYCMVIPFATFFLLLDEQRISKRMIGLVPNRYFEVTLNLMYNLNRQFGLILRGMFISVSIVSFLSSLGLWLIGLPFPIIIGVFAGVSNLIPYAGPVVGIAAAFVAAVMTGSPSEMYLSIVIVFVLVQIIDNALVSPIVMAKSANLHPLLVLFLVIFGSTFGGVAGMFLIVPVVSLCRVAFVTLWAELTRPSRPDFSLFRDVDAPPSCT